MHVTVRALYHGDLFQSCNNVVVIGSRRNFDNPNPHDPPSDGLRWSTVFQRNLPLRCVWSSRIQGSRTPTAVCVVSRSPTARPTTTCNTDKDLSGVLAMAVNGGMVIPRLTWRFKCLSVVDMAPRPVCP
jgi:hypothetical protein